MKIINPTIRHKELIAYNGKYAKIYTVQRSSRFCRLGADRAGLVQKNISPQMYDTITAEFDKSGWRSRKFQLCRPVNARRRIMPFIHSRVSTAMTEHQKETIKKELGEAIAIIPGKSEEWLMVELADQCCLYFRGSSEKALAYIEVKVFGKISEDEAQKLTERICAIYETHLQIKKECIYIKYEEVSKWGWNGSNF